VSIFKLGIIGGSGLYDLEKYKKVKYLDISTPWGKPSGQIINFEHKGKEIFFLPRHGQKHNIQPSFINYRANIDALKQLGVTDIISFSAVGSLNDAIKPGMFVLPDQFIDRTYKRANTFFDSDIVCHVSMSKPISESLMETCINALKEIGLEFAHKGTYVAIEGPQFSTHAESKGYKLCGADIIGMTNMPEAKLAREAEIRYATIGMVTDYDCYKVEYLDVDINQIISTLKNNIELAKKIIDILITTFDKNINKNDPIQTCLNSAIVTDISTASKETISNLNTIIRRYKYENK
jgi:5'-methylthioadenosine phosphorylase